MDKKSIILDFRENEVILREGEMFNLISGNVALYFYYGEENEYLIGVLSEGKCFGEVLPPEPPFIRSRKAFFGGVANNGLQ